MRKNGYVPIILAITLAFTLTTYGINVNISEQAKATDFPSMLTRQLFNDQKVQQVTLVTGDVVIATDLPKGQVGISIIPADPTKRGQSFQTFKAPEGTYVIPDGVNLHKLDMELFNIDYLISEGYNKMANLPVLVRTVGASEQVMQSVKTSIRNFKGSVTASFPRSSIFAAQLPLDTIKDSIQALLERQDVEKIWLNRKVHVSLHESVPLIGAPELWDAGYNGTGIEIAILDTGIDDTHPDLDDLDDNPDTIDPKVIGAIDFTDDNSTEDLFGHGTHCAGIAAGTGAASNGMYKGVAPGARLWNVKVLNQYGWGYWSWVIFGIEYAAYGPDGIANTGDEADIISMSLGGSPTNGTDPVSLAVNAAVDAGVAVVIAAGNAGDYFQISCPGVASEVITVGASDKYDNLAYFSSKGPTIDFRVKPDVLAPGVSITSSVPYSLYGTYYQSWSGTSMSTPHVAGAVALMLEARAITPLGWSPPKYVKNALISTGIDVGYNVYEQGGGRIYVPSALYTQILIDPATISFGRYAENTLDNATLTFFNLNATSNRILTLDVVVNDMYTGTQVDCASLNTTTLNIDGGSNASVLLTINTTVPKSTYSGRVVANIDTGETIHAIFGFCRVNELTITKVNMKGAPAAYDSVDVIGDPGFPEWMYGQTDEYGNVTFYVTDGTYHTVSIGWNYDTESTIYTIVENMSVTGDTVVYLDERNTVTIDLDMNKPNQIIAEKDTKLVCEGERVSIGFCAIWWYPATALAYISPTSFGSGFTYSYYPEAYYNSSEPGKIDTPEWHKLHFGRSNITEAVKFVADYSTLVQRTTDYKVAMLPDIAQRVQFVVDPIAPFDCTFGWQMKAPQTRVEWLSPEPAWYSGWYSKWDPMWDWDFWTVYGLSYPAATKTYFAFGEHPFSSGVEIHVGSTYVDVYGSISEDTFGNKFANWTRSISGNLTVIQDGVEVLHTEIWDHFYESISFSGTPEFTVLIEGSCDLSLSTNTYTELRFVANTAKDYRPPQVTMRPLGSDLYCTVPAGNVMVNVTASDDSQLSSVGLEYSLNDGATWISATEVQALDGSHLFNLGTLDDAYVSLRVNATDFTGNSISQTAIRGLYVQPAVIKVFEVTYEGKPYLVNVLSNSIIKEFNFSQPKKQISFNVTGAPGTSGFCNVTIPKVLLTANETHPWEVYVGGAKIPYTKTENNTHTFIYFTYSHSVQTVKIVGTKAIPEFPGWAPTLLMLFLLALGAALLKRKCGAYLTLH